MVKTKFEETHISQALIGPRYTYKIKKPVKFNFVDYSTLAKRKHFCLEEVRLNRRYSPSMYLGVVRLNNGEYAVKMKTLPAEKRLDKLLTKNQVTPQMIKRLAQVVWHFHRKAKAIKGKFGSAKLLRGVFYGNFQTTSKFVGKVISRRLDQQIQAYLLHFLDLHPDWFAQRIRAGKIRDLHGDLHSENIFYHKKPYIFDCIEFNSDFRYIDCAAEISFLIMDLECRGKNKLADLFLETYLKTSCDQDCRKLLNFYKCHYAYIRGSVLCLAGDFKLAAQHFKLAGQYIKTKPYLLAVGGIIGTGKSTLAKGLAEKWGAIWLRSDEIRKKLAGKLNPANTPHPRRNRPGFKQGIYSPGFTQKTYRAMLAAAEKFLRNGENVVLDASFSKRVFRKNLLRLVRRVKANFKFLETVASSKTILRRLKKRKKDISDAGPWLLNQFKQNYEPPTEMPVIKIVTARKKAAHA
ncbi:MAG: AAA family ATPase [Candidatus Margulisiibacteriota bacterium]